MKKAKQYSKDLQKARDQESEKRLKKKDKLIKNLQNTTNENLLKKRTDFMADAKAITSGIICDNCNTELVNYGDILSTKSPMRKHICLGCGRTYTIPL